MPETMDRVVRLGPTLRNFIREKLIAVRTSLASLSDTFDNYGVCKDEADLVLAYLPSDGADVMYEAYIANRMRTDAQVFQETWPMVINAVTQKFFIKDVLQDSHDLVS